MLARRLRAAVQALAGGGGIPATGLLSHYDMETISGSTLTDLAGNYDGTITGTTDVAGYTGRARNFNGSSDQVAFGNAWSEMTGNMTIAVRMNSTKYDSVAVSKYAAVPAFWELLGRADSGSGGKAGSIIGSAGSNDVTLDTVDVTSYPAWPLMVAVYSGTSLDIYINDMTTPVASKTFTRDNTNAAVDGYIGRRAYPGAEAWFGGDIDAVALYTVALSEADRIELAAKL